MVARRNFAHGDFKGRLLHFGATGPLVGEGTVDFGAGEAIQNEAGACGPPASVISG